MTNYTSFELEFAVVFPSFPFYSILSASLLSSCFSYACITYVEYVVCTQLKTVQEKLGKNLSLNLRTLRTLRNPRNSRNPRNPNYFPWKTFPFLRSPGFVFPLQCSLFHSSHPLFPPPHALRNFSQSTVYTQN